MNNLSLLATLIVVGLTSVFSVNAQTGELHLRSVTASEQFQVGTDDTDKMMILPNQIQFAPLTPAGIETLTPGEGAVIYNTASDIMMYYNGTEWVDAFSGNTTIEEPEELCPSMVEDYDGNYYTTVYIGTQCWMAENLNVTHFSDGTAISHVTAVATWNALTITDYAYCYYDDPTPGTNGDAYGALYTWAAAMNGAPSSIANPSGVQGVCPEGWHVPSNSEWNVLAASVGGVDIAGQQLKEAGLEHWQDDEGTNESGFTAVGGGFCSESGFFDQFLSQGRYWCSSQESATDSYYFHFNSFSIIILELTRSKKAGLSVRCLKDL